MMSSNKQKISPRNLTKHPLVATLVSLRGNERACVYTEPLWGIPYNLYSPFLTVYMYALGVNDRQIGLMLSIGMIFQVFAALMGGVMTDKLGRRRATVIFDTLSWSIPALLWMFSQNFWWFLAAAILNSMWQITNNSWTCLMVEDCDQNKLVHMFTWCTISGLLAVFFAPAAGILVDRLTIIPAMRIIFGLTFVMMTTKFYILFFKSHETSRGVIRMRETRGIPIRKLLVEYIDIARQVAKTPRTLLIIGIMVILNITAAVSNNFFALYATQNLGIPDAWLAWFPIGRAIVMLIFIFTIQTALSHLSFRIPVLIGLILYIASQLILITTKPEQLLPLILYILLEAFAFALVIPQKDSMMVKFIDPVERARVSSIVYMSMIAISSPFGWIAGELSQRDRSWPFIMNMVLFSLCFLLIVYTKRIKLTDNT